MIIDAKPSALKSYVQMMKGSQNHVQMSLATICNDMRKLFWGIFAITGNKKIVSQMLSFDMMPEDTKIAFQDGFTYIKANSN